MAKPGPAPKPTQLRILQGNPSKRPINEHEPKPKVVKKRPKPPVALTKLARKFWKDYCDILIACQTLTDADLMLLARYCDALEDWCKARENKLKFGRAIPKYEWVRDYVKNEKGEQTVKMVKQIAGFIKNPDATAFTEASRDLLRMEQELGLTPASRSRILVGNGERGLDDDDTLETYLFAPRN